MKDYSYYLKNIGEYGLVREVRLPLVTIVGLPYAKLNEVVFFEGGQMGQIFSLDEDSAEVLVFYKRPVSVGEQLVRTDVFINIPVGEDILGSIVDPLGNIIFTKKNVVNFLEERQLEIEVAGIDRRTRIKKPLETGVTIIDLLIPIGKGQRELIIGDRNTGKSSFLLTIVKNQVKMGTVAIYASIGRKKSSIKKLQEFFEREGIMDKIVIVASYSDDAPSLVYLTPYTAMSIAEYFRDQGRDTLVILDDLSVHAKFYREIALLGKVFPGRDSYPGDIFYTQARLMERAGNFKSKNHTEASITCLPVVETVEGDIAGFIPTNLMGMTDGHIFFDSNAFYKGRRPAINVSLSVTRVGRQTQSHLKRQLNRELTAFLTTYEKTQNYAHFGAELSEKVKSILKMGEKLYAFFDQHYSLTVPEEIQLIILGLIWLHTFDNQPNEVIENIRRKMLNLYNDEKTKKFFQKLVSVNTFNELLLSVAKNKDKLISL